MHSGKFSEIEVSEFGIKIEKLQFLPWKLCEIKNFTIKKDGLDAYIANLRLEWSFDSFSAVHVDRLFVTKVLVKSLPSSPQTTSKVSVETKPIDIESLVKTPIPLHIDLIQIDQVKILPLFLELSLRGSQSASKLNIGNLTIKQKDNKVSLNELSLDVQKLTQLKIQKIKVAMKQQKLLSLSNLETKVDLVDLVKHQKLGATNIEEIILHSLPKSSSTTVQEVVLDQKPVSSDPSKFDLAKLKSSLDEAIPKVLPVSQFDFGINSIRLGFLPNTVKKLKVQLSKSSQFSVSCKITNADKGDIQLDTKVGLENRKLDVKLLVNHWIQKVHIDLHKADVSMNGKLRISFKNFEDNGSNSNLDLNLLYSQSGMLGLTLPMSFQLNEGLIKIESPKIESSVQGQIVTLAFLSELKIYENLDLDLQQALISDLHVDGLAKIKSILVKAKTKDNFKNCTATLDIGVITEQVTAVKGNVKSMTGKASVLNYRDLKADMRISDIHSDIMKLDLIESKLSGNLDDFSTITYIRDISSEDMGNLTQIQLKSIGNLKSQKADYSILGYKIKDSSYPEISGIITWKDALLKGITNMSFAHLKPADFQSFTNVPAKLKIKSSSEEVVIETTTESSMPIHINWKIQPLNDQIIHIVDEQYKLDVQADIEYDSKNNLSGTIRILDGTLKYSDYDLKVLDTGYLTFHQKADDSGKSEKSLELSTTTTNYMDQLAHLSKQDEVSKNFYLKDGIEVLLKLGMKWQEKDIVVKVSGIYPDMKIRLFDDSGKEIEGGFVGLLKGGVGSSEAEAPEEDLSKVLGDQVLSIANSKVDNYFNEKFKKQGIKIKTDFKPGEKKGFGIQKKLGHRILLDYYRSQDQRDDRVTEMRKMQYLLKGSSSLFLRQDTQSVASESDMSMGVQRRIKF